MGGRRERFLGSTLAVRAVLANRDIGRLEFSWLASIAANLAFLVVTLVVAYDIGGAPAVGIVGVAHFLPPMLIAPFAGIPTARWRPDRILLAVQLIRASAIGLAALLLVVDAPPGVLLVLVAIEAGSGGLARPLHMSLLPWLARSPGELVAANVVASAAEGVGALSGPAVAALLLATTGGVEALAVITVVMLVSAGAIHGLRVPIFRARSVELHVRAGLAAGARAVAGTPGLRTVFVGFGCQTFVRGLLTVLIVVAALELLGMGEPGVGTLHAAMGAGGFLGAFVALGLSGRSRLSPAFSLALAFWGLPILVIGLGGGPVIAVAMLLVVGMSNAVLDVTGYTLIQRTTPNQARAAVMGLLDGVANGCIALGGIVAPLLIGWLGVESALLVAGAILPLAAVILWPSVRDIDAQAVVPEAQSRLLRGDPLFAPLSLSVIEELAGALAPATFAAGEHLIVEGEPGDRYLIVVSGEIEVSQGGRPLGVLGPGAGVGEIALLRDVPRTASVRAMGPVSVFELDRGSFLAAVCRQAAATLLAGRTQGTPTDDEAARGGS